MLAFIFHTSKPSSYIAPFEAILTHIAKAHNLAYAKEFIDTNPPYQYAFILAEVDSSNNAGIKSVFDKNTAGGRISKETSANAERYPLFSKETSTNAKTKPTPKTPNTDDFSARVLGFADELSRTLPLSMYFIFDRIEPEYEASHRSPRFCRAARACAKPLPMVSDILALIQSFEKQDSSFSRLCKQFFSHIHTPNPKDPKSSRAITISPNALYTLLDSLSHALLTRSVIIATTRGSYELSRTKSKQSALMFWEMGALQSFMRIDSTQLSCLASVEKPSMKLCPKDIFREELLGSSERVEIECLLAFDPMLMLLGSLARTKGVEYVFIRKARKPADLSYSSRFCVPKLESIVCGRDGIYLNTRKSRHNLFSIVAKHYPRPLESTFCDGDSVLGEQCGSVANFVKGTTTKVANLPQSLQSSHSPTATPRILEEDNRGGFEKSAKNQNQPQSKKVDSSNEAFSSSFGSAIAARQSIQTKTQNLESTFENNAEQIQKTQKKDSSNEAMDCHATATQCLAMTENNAASEKVDSRKNAESVKTSQNENAAGGRIFLKKHRLTPSGVPCFLKKHRFACFDENAQTQKVDSSKQAQSLNKSQATGFADDFVGFQGGGEGIYLSGNEQAPAAESRKSAAKPKPKTQREQNAHLMLVCYLSMAHSSAVWIYDGASYKQALPVRFASSEASMLETLAREYKGADRLLANYQAHFGALSALELDSSPRISTNLTDIFAIIARVLGFCESGASDDCAKESLLNYAKLCLRDKGPRIDYKLKKAPQGGIELDYPRILRSCMSFALAGVEREMIAFGVLDSLAEFMGNFVRDMSQNYAIKQAFICGDMLSHKIFFDKILLYLPRDITLILPQDGYIDTL